MTASGCASQEGSRIKPSPGGGTTLSLSFVACGVEREKTEKEECGGLWRMLYVCTCIDVNHLSMSLVQAYKTQP